MPNDLVAASSSFFFVLLLGGLYLLCEKLGFIGSPQRRERDDDLFDDRDDGDGGDGGDGGSD
ncbi:hypothetical protein [uncultured Cardiobacterium sp.]|uniref:hypothetical protein n=1 Tax=uncultured Cardiobacterium sp. TaxID=417619 RepID=UPI00262008DE|nr:hypothetical protein [uncultured Cardiobacterium sp.]